MGLPQIAESTDAFGNPNVESLPEPKFRLHDKSPGLEHRIHLIEYHTVLGKLTYH